MATSREVLIPDAYYHVYNRAIGDDVLFKNDRNYYYFLKLSNDKLIDCLDFISYCLMPNHFHFLVRVKSRDILIQVFSKDESIDDKELSDLISRRIGNVCNSYAQAFNKENKRMGSLFIGRFKRTKITSDNYLRNLIIYIHSNPLNAGLVRRIEVWKFSSYRAIISYTPNLVNREEAIAIFGDLKNFVFAHRGKRRSSDGF